MRILNWNVRWANVKSKWGPQVLKKISSYDTEVICVTESYEGFLPGGHTITSDEDYGYKITQGKRKVLLWSKNPWQDIDTVGSEELPSGRFVSGITNTSLGEIRFIGICIPWDGAHVTTGRKDRRAWEDHTTYLGELKEILNEPADIPTIILGDFNQRIPRIKQPKRVFNQLMDTIPPHISIATTGVLPNIEEQVIDHVCHTKDLSPKSLLGIDKRTADGQAMSDHLGIVMEFSKS